MDETIDISAISFFQPLGYQSNSCGYCKQKHSSPSYYAQSSRVRPDHYQELVDRGWRRSGRIYYKPDLPRSCCPHYTIRLQAADFRPRKDQRKAVNRWNEYVLGPDYIRQAAHLAPKTKEEKRRRKNVFDLGLEVHRAEYSNVKRPIDPTTKKPIEPAHRFDISLESDSFSESKWHLFQRYQQAVHREPKSKNTKRTFERFLCSGLRRSTVTANGKSKKLGSYHLCYRLDGKLVAIAVLDLLPHAVSAVYLLYDPDFEQYQFGKLSAMREITLALEQGYDFYYMGYYIHSCVKMKYKADFWPQQVLDPASLEWGPLDQDMLRKLDQHPYYSRSTSEQASSGVEESESGRRAEAVSSREQLTLDQEETEHQGKDGRIETNGDGANSDSERPEQRENSEEEDGDDSDPAIPEGSIFDLAIPGVMTKEEVESQIDLSQWKLMIQGQIVEFEDLRGWDHWSIDDPQSLKGIAAELAAAVGPNVVKESVVMLFE